MRKRNVFFQFLLQSWYGFIFFAKAMFSSKNKNDMEDGKKNDADIADQKPPAMRLWEE